MGVTIFSLGIGKEYKKDELDEMATDPDSAHVLTGDFDELDQVLPKIKKQCCAGECARKSQQAPALCDTYQHLRGIGHVRYIQSNLQLRPSLLGD